MEISRRTTTSDPVYLEKSSGLFIESLVFVNPTPLVGIAGSVPADEPEREPAIARGQRTSPAPATAFAQERDRCLFWRCGFCIPGLRGARCIGSGHVGGDRGFCQPGSLAI